MLKDIVQRVLLALALIVGLIAAPANAQEEEPAPSLDRTREAIRDALESIWNPRVPAHRLSNGWHVRSAFRDVVAEASKSTVQVRGDGRTVALGGIVGPDGWVLTKASQLKGTLTVLLKDQRELDARVVGVDRPHDLAVLKIDAKGLSSLTMEASSTAPAGAWVATPGLQRDPVAVGVVSVAPRKIAHRAGILGVQLDDSDVPDVPGALVEKVFNDSGAQRAGVQVNDIITGVNGQAIKRRQDLIVEVRRFSPFDEIELEIRRGDKKIILTAELTGSVKEMFPQTRSQYQNSLGGELSKRRFGFPLALQHDTVLKPKECGGPLVDLDGRVIGFNIARAGRTESYAIPTSSVLPLMYKLMSGEQKPEG